MTHMPPFDAFRAQLDDDSDRRERLIKVSVPAVTTRPCSLPQASRDVTTISKRTIFLLHRILGPAAPPAAREMLQDVHRIYASLKHDLDGDRFWRYHRQVSPGLQEYIEALSFAHYLQHKSLISFDQVQRTLCGPDGVP
ncbi:hypothetical protein H0H87_005838, partial [Tephrocybe sp. NHM501043]